MYTVHTGRILFIFQSSHKVFQRTLIQRQRLLVISSIVGINSLLHNLDRLRDELVLHRSLLVVTVANSLIKMRPQNALYTQMSNRMDQANNDESTSYDDGNGDRGKMCWPPHPQQTNLKQQICAEFVCVCV
jgi:hypothetical protein